MRMTVALFAILGAFLIGALTALYFRPPETHEKVVNYGSVSLCVTPCSESRQSNLVAQLMEKLTNAGLEPCRNSDGSTIGWCGMTLSGNWLAFASTNAPISEIDLIYGRIPGQDVSVFNLFVFPSKDAWKYDYAKLLFDSQKLMFDTVANQASQGTRLPARP